MGMEYREAMDVEKKKVEIVIEYGIYDRDMLKFKRWLFGWLYDKYGLVAKAVEGDGLIIFEAEGDVFKLFDELRIETKLALRNIRVDVKALGVCSGDECVVVDNVRSVGLLNGSVLKKLDKMINKVGSIVGYGKVEGIDFVSRGNMIAIYMDGCYTRLYINEAFVVAADLVKFVSDASGLELSKWVNVVYDVFEPPEPRSLEIDFLVGEDGVMLFIDGCSRDLKFGETLRLAYWLMKLSLNQLLLQKKIEEWGS
jgi:hypothetical protein